MEEVAQGRVWTGKEAVSRGLVDAIGILNVKVTFVELSRPSPTLPEILVGIGNTVVGVDRTLQELLQDLASFDEIQARMDGVMFQKLDGLKSARHVPPLPLPEAVVQVSIPLDDAAERSESLAPKLLLLLMPRR
ncbi:serine protease SPPA, chloroplastic-like [Camellia sinensis]|uniref:serine protease SPPA, chloroplastic-like n=1 Tax=Camellia sinensis TaxID=4442 RepID=UPI001036F1EF|nr:serine protease SPPA, chloroplastic-like [Camellia sinensis]